jgi:hypothetical protein
VPAEVADRTGPGTVSGRPGGRTAPAMPSGPAL